MNEFISTISTICLIGEKVKGNTGFCNFFHGVATLKTGEQQHEFRFSEMNSGLYFVKIIAGDYV